MSFVTDLANYKKSIDSGQPTSYWGTPSTNGGQATGSTTTQTQNPYDTGTSPVGSNLDTTTSRTLWQQVGQDPLKFIQEYAQRNNITPSQMPTTTRRIVDALKSVGVNVDYETPDEYGRSAGLIYNGTPYKIVNGSDQWMWDSYVNAEGAAPGTMPPGWSAGGGGNFDPSRYTMGGQFNYTPYQPSSSMNDLVSLLTQRANQTLQLDPKDPIIANQVNAYSANQQRMARNQMKSLAEQQGPNANLNFETRAANENVRQNTGNLQAQLMQHEVDARRQEIQQALTEWGSLLSEQDRLALQKELAYLSNDQFLRNLGLQAEQQASYWDAVRSGLI